MYEKITFQQLRWWAAINKINTLYSLYYQPASKQVILVMHLNHVHTTHVITSRRKIPENVPLSRMFIGDREFCRSDPKIIPRRKSRWTADLIHLMIINIPMGSCQGFVDCFLLLLNFVVIRDKHVVCPVKRCFTIISTVSVRVTRGKSQDSPSNGSKLRGNKVEIDGLFVYSCSVDLV